MDKDKFIIDNYATMSDSKLGKQIGLSKDQTRYLRKKLGLLRDESKYGIVSYEYMREDLIKDIKSHAYNYKKIKYPKITEGHLLVIDPADIHIGKLSLTEEVGGEYNIKLAKERVKKGVAGIIEKAKGFPIDKIALIIGNDIIHIDTPFRTTTSGTPQDTDGQWWQMFLQAKDLYVSIIEELREIAPVHVIYNPSNHEFLLNVFYLALSYIFSYNYPTRKILFIHVSFCHIVYDYSYYLKYLFLI